MKQQLIALLALVGVSAFAANPTITSVTAKQRYPWNGKVDITYTVSGSFSQPAQLKVTATDRTTSTTYTANASALSGDTGTASGTHRLVWDLNAQGLAFKSDNVAFTVAYESIPLYCVINLSAGASARSYPVTYMDAPPSGGFNTDEYKTTKLVLRLIPSGTFTMGYPNYSSNPARQVTLTKSYYCGVFEVTQKQYELVMGNNPIDNMNSASGPSSYKGDKRPVVNITWHKIRGSSLTYNWPTVTSVAPSSFIGRIRARTGLHLDLPTETQWEYACKAGTASAYNNGGDSEDDLNQLGRYKGNESDGKGGCNQYTTVVGSYLPNNWGLYDMHGNAFEWCLDHYQDLGYYVRNGLMPPDGLPPSGTDPLGPSSGDPRVARGGDFDSNARWCVSHYREGYEPSYTGGTVRPGGFRIVATLPE